MKIESIVIVKNGQLGYSAAVHFSDPTKNRLLTASSRESIEKIVDRVVYEEMPHLKP